jgi:hypothetical protein
VDSSDNGGSNLGSVMSSKNFTNIPKTGEEYQFNHGGFQKHLDIN